jgi:hypothetical protein
MADDRAEDVMSIRYGKYEYEKIEIKNQKHRQWG